MESLVTTNPHHPPPGEPPLSWDVRRADGAAGGLTDDMDAARCHLLDGMRAAGAVEGTIRRAFPGTGDEIRYGPVLVRVHRDEDSGALLNEDEVAE